MSAFRGQLLGSTAADEDDAAAKALEHQHKFLTAAQKRKVAAITGDVNINGESCLAYVVINDADRARALITAADGSIFMGRTLRVDTVRPPGAKKGDAPTETTAEEKKRLAEEERRTCFVGGLDFAETEEGLRKWVEAKLTEERGEAEADDEEDIPSGGIRWVQRVRIVRDKATGLGKGFAYVLLRVRRLPASCLAASLTECAQDRDCVDELLALPATEAKLSKRKLRFQRCKSAAKLEAEAAKPAQKLAAKEQRAQLGKLPKSAQVKATKRDPTKARAMAKKLEGLSKDERKVCARYRQLRFGRWSSRTGRQVDRC
jgi:nucleolar protein 12